MILVFYFFSIVAVLYGFFITLAIIGINNLNKPSKYSSHILNGPFVSIIVSVKNEEGNAELFVSEIDQQLFDKHLFELIVIDDFSSDDTVKLFKVALEKTSLNFKIIQQPIHKGKKQNLSEAIAISKGSIIITTDADIIYRHPKWLYSIVRFFETNHPNLLVMPIDFKNQKNILSFFQTTENIALTGITAGFCGINKPFLCNGANLAFSKQAYETVGGYKNHIHFSSGEDVFLLEDLKQLDQKKIQYGFQHELIVKTKPVLILQDFINQRLRWANKAKHQSNFLNLFFGFIVVSANLIFIALPVAFLNQLPITPYLSIFIVAKLIFDLLLLFLASKFLGNVKYCLFLFPFECVYWLYALIIGFGSLFFKPKWKGINIK